MDKFMIQHSQIITGLFLCLERVDSHLEISENLHESNNYLQSIGISTICFEEAMKGKILSDKFRHLKGITSPEWNNITKHEYKLKDYHKELDNRNGIKSEKEFEEIHRKISALGLLSRSENFTDFQTQIKKDYEIYPKIKILRERCFYVDWNKSKNNWNLITSLKKSELESLSLFMLAEASLEERYLLLDVEVIVNGLRKNNIKIKNCQFPTYNEYREVDNYQSWEEIREIQRKVELNRKKLNTGLQIFRSVTSN